MASPPTDSATNDGNSIHFDSIPVVDLRLFTQSELFSLSQCSSSAAERRRLSEIVDPKIDRSVFNESAGSRRQTYFRLRLAPPGTPRRKNPQHRATGSSNFGPERAENAEMIILFKELFCPDANFDELVPDQVDDILDMVKLDDDELVLAKLEAEAEFTPIELADEIIPVEIADEIIPFSSPSASNVGRKRKRGRPRMNELLSKGPDSVNDNVDKLSMVKEISVHENFDDRDKVVVNRDGMAVDFVALGMVEHPYSDEFRHRTEGLENEAALLGFLKGINGQWGTSRKKRRIVDASEFGNVLPTGWKLLLYVKKKSGRVSLDCRRYISPSGREFLSCKEVSSYLLSLHGAQGTNKTDIINADKLTPEIDDHTKENAGVLPHQIIGEMICCSKCTMTFSERDDLLQHQSSLHRKKRITDGVIIKDGKYECQICHKSFTEKRKYNGHMGAHVKNQAKIPNESEGGSKGSFGSEITKNGPDFSSPVDKENNGNLGDSNEANGKGVKGSLGSESTKNAPSSSSLLGKENAPFRDSEVENGNNSQATIATESEEAKRSFGSESTKNGPDFSSHFDEENGNFRDSKEADNGFHDFSGYEPVDNMDCVIESNLFDSIKDVKEYEAVQMNGQNNELKFDGQDFAINDPIFDFFGHDEDSAKLNKESNAVSWNEEESASVKYAPEQDPFGGLLLDKAYTVKNDTGGGKIGTSGPSIKFDFGSNIAQPVTSDVSKRICRDSSFEGCFNEVKENPHGVTNNYDINFTDPSRPSRTEPVEFSFMGELNSNSEESNNFSYYPNMEQGLDPSFWLRKDGVMANATNNHMVTSNCVWCENEFHHEPLQSGAVGGSMCSLCISRFTG